MALAYDASSSFNGVLSPTLNSPHTCTGSDLILLVGFGLWNAGGAYGLGLPSSISVTYGGTPMTQAGYKDNGTTLRTYLYYLVSPATGLNNITITAFTGYYVAGGAVSLTGADQSTPLGTLVSASGTSTGPTVDAASAAGEIVVDSLGVVGAPTATVGAGQTQRWNTAYSTDVTGAGSQEDGAASVTMSWTLSTSAAWAICAVPVKPGTGGGSNTTVTEIWPIPARTEPLAFSSSTEGLIGRALATMYPHLLAWRYDGARFTWHDLGPALAFGSVDSLACGPVPVGLGTDPGLILMGMDTYDGVLLTALGSSSVGGAKRRFPSSGGFPLTNGGLLYGSRVEFDTPQRLTAIRVWGENFQSNDTLYFAYRWDRGQWFSLGRLVGVPTGELPVTDQSSGLFLEWVVGFYDAYANEPNLPVITRVDALTESAEIAILPQPNTQAPELE